MRKAISPLVSGVIYTGIIVIAISFVVSMVVPAIDVMSDSLKLENAKDTMSSIDIYMQKVASAGEGSRRTIPVSFDIGKLYIDSENDKIILSVETDSRSISPGTSITIGNLKIHSNAKTNVSNINGSYVLENEHMVVNVFGNGTASDPVNISFEDLIDSVYQKETGKNMTGIGLYLDTINSAYCWADGIKGNYLGRGRIIQHCNASGDTFDIYVILESGADFLKVSIRNCNSLHDNISVDLNSPLITSSVIDSGNVYISSEKNGTVLSLVSGSKAETSGAASSISMIQKYDGNEFYIVFTKAGNAAIASRVRDVVSREFESYYNPSFGFSMSRKNQVELSLVYSSIDIEGPSKILHPGDYMLSIENNGTVGSKINMILRTI